MIDINSLRYLDFDEVCVTNEEDDFRDEDINIVYKDGVRLSLTRMKCVIMVNNKPVEAFYYPACSEETLAILNHEVTRAIHDVTCRTFKVKTDCKRTTILHYLEGVESKYLRKLLMVLLYLHADFDSHGGVIFEYGVSVNGPSVTAADILAGKDSVDRKAERNLNFALEKIKIGDIKGGLKYLGEAINIKPCYERAYFERARANKNDLIAALIDYDKVIELNPRNAQAFNNRGNIKKRRGDLTGAIDDYKKAIELKPSLTEAIDNLEVLRRNQR